MKIFLYNFLIQDEGETEFFSPKNRIKSTTQ